MIFLKCCTVLFIVIHNDTQRQCLTMWVTVLWVQKKGRHDSCTENIVSSDFKAPSFIKHALFLSSIVFCILTLSLFVINDFWIVWKLGNECLIALYRLKLARFFFSFVPILFPNLNYYISVTTWACYFAICQWYANYYTWFTKRFGQCLLNPRCLFFSIYFKCLLISSLALCLQTQSIAALRFWARNGSSFSRLVFVLLLAAPSCSLARPSVCLVFLWCPFSLMSEAWTNKCMLKLSKPWCSS